MLTPKYFFFQHPAASGLQLLAVACLVCIGHPSSSTAADNGVSLTPQMGWSSWSFLRSQPTEAIIQAQAVAMHKNLQSHGFDRVNLDDFWYVDARTTVDQYGRWVTDTTKFPSGMAALGKYIHSLGLKFGIRYSGDSRCSGQPEHEDRRNEISCTGHCR